MSDKYVGNDSDILACAAKNGITGNRQCVNKSMLSSIGFSEIRLQSVFMVFMASVLRCDAWCPLTIYREASFLRLPIMHAIGGLFIPNDLRVIWLCHCYQWRVQ